MVIYKKKMQLANTFMKKISIKLVNKEIYIKTIMRNHFLQINC